MLTAERIAQCKKIAESADYIHHAPHRLYTSMILELCLHIEALEQTIAALRTPAVQQPERE